MEKILFIFKNLKTEHLAFSSTFLKIYEITDKQYLSTLNKASFEVRCTIQLQDRYNINTKFQSVLIKTYEAQFKVFRMYYLTIFKQPRDFWKIERKFTK